jgi:hypothetical protein
MGQSKRLVLASLIAAWVAALATVVAQAAAPVATLHVVSGLSTLPRAPFDALATDSSPALSSEMPYYVRTISATGNDKASALSVLGSSRRPFDVSADPRGGPSQPVAYSTCPASQGPGVPHCAVYVRSLVGDSTPTIVGSASSTGSTRLPAIYAGTVAAVHTEDGTPASTIVYRFAGERLTGPVPGAPRGIDKATATGLALRKTRLAYVWRWISEPGIRLNGLYVQTLSTHTPTVLASYSTRDARIVGPVWAGSKVMWLVRRKRGSRWYRWSQSTHRYEAAVAPNDVASFTVSASNRLFWQRAPRTAEIGDPCPAGCPVYSRALPRFHRVSPP